jgi:hypothetical protein
MAYVQKDMNAPSTNARATIFCLITPFASSLPRLFARMIDRGVYAATLFRFFSLTSSVFPMDQYRFFLR